MTLSRGEGKVGDLWLANALFRAVLRHPASSQTLVGIGGGTVVDAAPWGVADRLHEVAPLVQGGGLRVTDYALFEDGIQLVGTVTALPDRPIAHEGAAAEVFWRIAPDAPYLTLEGADGLWMHGSGEHSLTDGWLWYDEVVYGHDGVSEDLGGAIRVEDATRLVIGSAHQVMALRAGDDGVAIDGRTDDASQLALYRGLTRVGRLPVEAGEDFQAVLPREIDGLRAEAPGHAPGPLVSPGTGLSVSAGATGAVELRPGWLGRPRPLKVAYEAADGRAGHRLLPSDGAVIDLGAGAYDLWVSAGPAWESQALHVEIPPDQTVYLGVELAPRFDPGHHVLALTDWPSDRSRTWRGSDYRAVWEAWASGSDWVALTPEDEIAAATGGALGFPPIPHRNGSMTLDRDGAWAIRTWEWKDTPSRSGHGAVDLVGLDANDALAAAIGGPARDHHSTVEIGWLQAATSPWAVDPIPEGVHLVPPGLAGPAAAWGPWFDWLDAGRALAPMGPAVWVEVTDPDVLGAEDVEQQLTAGRTIGTTGPLLLLQFAGNLPGDQVAESLVGLQGFTEITLLGGRDLDHLALIGSGGQILAEWTPTGDTFAVTSVVQPGRWVLAAAWDDLGTSFAVTAPVWIDPTGAGSG